MTSTNRPIDSAMIDWVPLREGLAFRPLHFADDGYSLQLRVEPGVTIARHRHTGEVHAYNLSGKRELIESGEITGPGTYVFEPAGNVDSWRCVGDEPCTIQISLKGRVEYLDDGDAVIEVTDTFSARDAYLNWCDAKGVTPNRSLVPADGSTTPCHASETGGQKAC